MASETSSPSTSRPQLSPIHSESEGYNSSFSWSTADSECEKYVVNYETRFTEEDQSDSDTDDGIDGETDSSTPILVNTDESSQRYLAARGLNDVVAIQKVANPDDRSEGVLFMKETHVLGKNLIGVVLRNEFHNPSYVMGVQVIKDKEKLHFLEKISSLSNTQLWKIAFSGQSNALFSLYLTEDQTGNGVRYYALPDEDKTSMILRSSVTLNTDSTEVCIFSWPRFTLSKPMELFTNIQPTSQALPNGDCTKTSHEVCIKVNKGDGDQYMFMDDHNNITTRSKDDQIVDTNDLFYWKNVQEQEGCYITLEKSNKGMVGVDTIQDGEVLKCGNNSNHRIKLEYFDNRVTSERFSLSFASQNGQYYILPSSNGVPMKIHSNPTSDVFVFKIGDINCMNEEGACVFGRLMRTYST